MLFEDGGMLATGMGHPTTDEALVGVQDLCQTKASPGSAGTVLLGSGEVLLVLLRGRELCASRGCALAYGEGTGRAQTWCLQGLSRARRSDPSTAACC